MATTKTAKSRSRAAQFSKTKMCKFEILGMCTKGTSCPFAHSAGEINPLPDLSRTKLCKQLLQTGSCNKPGCSYAHSKDELRVGGVYKTKICRFFSENGHCALGTRCSFAHSDCEVRPIGVPAPPSPPMRAAAPTSPPGFAGAVGSPDTAASRSAAAVGVAGVGADRSLVHLSEPRQPQSPPQLLQPLPPQLPQPQQFFRPLPPPMQLPQAPQPPAVQQQHTQRAQQAPPTLQQEPSRKQERKQKQKGQVRQQKAATEPLTRQLAPPSPAPAPPPAIQTPAPATAVPPTPMGMAPRPYIPSVGLDVLSALQAAYPVPRGILHQQSELISRLGRLEDRELLNNPAYVAIEENTAHIVLGSLVIDQQDNVLKIRTTNPSKIPSPSLRPMRPVRTSETTLCSLSDAQL